MKMTIAQALADRMRAQTEKGQAVLEVAGEHSGAVFGNPEDVLTVCGNVSDIAHTNQLWLDDLVSAGLSSSPVPASLQRSRATSMEEAVGRLSPRESDTPEQALQQLRAVNEAIAALVEKLSDEQIDTVIDCTFYGRKTVRDLLFAAIEHGSLHLGQAWGILKGKGLAK